MYIEPTMGNLQLIFTNYVFQFFTNNSHTKCKYFILVVSCIALMHRIKFVFFFYKFNVGKWLQKKNKNEIGNIKKK